jgi:SRSO17 transposase
VEMALRRAGKGYVLGVASTTQVHSWDKPEPVSGTAEAIAAALPASRWGRRSAGAGGPRLYDYLELADLDARAFFDCRSASTMWTRGLLIRRGLSDAKMAFFSTWCPKGTPMAVLVEVEGRRWAIEDAFETAKTELAHNETRSWHGWHRHVSLVMLAFALLMVIRHKADTSPQKRPPTEQHKLCGPSRRSVVLPGV